MALGALPFQYYTTVDLIHSMIRFPGDIPPKWRSKWEHVKPSSDHALRETGYASKSRLEELINSPALDWRTRKLLLVVRDLMRLLPKDCMSASEALGLIRKIY